MEHLHRHHVLLAKICSALLYCGISTSMAFVNKILMNRQDFTCIYCMLSMQMLVTVMVLETLRSLSLIPLLPFSLTSSYNLILASGSFACHAVLSLDALRGMDIPMYGAIKRCTPLVTLILSTLILKKPVPPKFTILSIVLITVGCLLAGLGEVEHNARAYVMGGLAVIAQACYLIFIQMSSESGYSTMTILQVNSFNNMPVFAIMALCSGEAFKVIQQLHDSSTLVWFWLTVILGAFLNFALFLCTAWNDALTTSLVNVTKSVLQTFIGELILTDAPRTPLFLTGITMNLVGGTGYAWNKYTKREKTPSNAQ